MTDTNGRLAEIRARLDAATPAPWTRFARNAAAPDEDDWYLGHDVHGPARAQRGQIERVADAELIAHAPDDLAHLLTLVDQLQGQLDEARAVPARPAAQDRASGPETPQGHPSEGTGVPGPHGAAQAADLTPAEQAAAEHFARLYNMIAPEHAPAVDAEQFTTEARAVVAAARPLIEADALDALAEAATTYGPPSTDHLRGVAFTVRQTRTPVRDWLARDTTEETR